MSVDFFLIEGPRAVPVEFTAWQLAMDEWRSAAWRVFACQSWVGSDFDSLNARAIELQAVAAEAERTARSAFQVWVKQ